MLGGLIGAYIGALLITFIVSRIIYLLLRIFINPPLAAIVALIGTLGLAWAFTDTAYNNVATDRVITFYLPGAVLWCALDIVRYARQPKSERPPAFKDIFRSKPAPTVDNSPNKPSLPCPNCKTGELKINVLENSILCASCSTAGELVLSTCNNCKSDNCNQCLKISEPAKYFPKVFVCHCNHNQLMS